MTSRTSQVATAGRREFGGVSGDFSRLDLTGVRAVLLDVDGTLYRQQPVRLRMALEMATVPLMARSLTRAFELARVIREFRNVREGLRALGSPAQPLVELQFDETARRLGLDACAVERTVTEWMFRRPLRHLRSARRAGVETFLQSACRAGLLVGALSDYPVAEKVQALDLTAYFSVALCTTDRAINAFKPHPCGFFEACRIWGVVPGEVLYVGDRPEVDATGARAAGMRCAIVGPHGHERGRNDRDFVSVRGFADLEVALAAV